MTTAGASEGRAFALGAALAVATAGGALGAANEGKVIPLMDGGTMFLVMVPSSEEVVLRGQVQDQSGKPLPAQNVCIRGTADGRTGVVARVSSVEGRESIESILSATTDAEGRFEIAAPMLKSVSVGICVSETLLVKSFKKIAAPKLSVGKLLEDLGTLTLR